MDSSSTEYLVGLNCASCRMKPNGRIQGQLQGAARRRISFLFENFEDDASSFRNGSKALIPGR